MSSILIAALANVLIAASLAAFDRTRGKPMSPCKPRLVAAPLRRGRAAPPELQAKNGPHR
jgi:hypothetical protein